MNSYSLKQKRKKKRGDLSKEAASAQVLGRHKMGP